MKSEVACKKRLNILSNISSKINSLETDTYVLEYVCNDFNEIKRDSFVKI